MKKIILTLLSLVLICTMCIGFVACDENDINNDVQQPTPEEPEMPQIEKQSLEGYILDKQFAFGTFVKDYEFPVGGKPVTRDEFPHRYDIVIENDTVIDGLMPGLQTLYNNCVEENPQLDESHKNEFLGVSLKDLIAGSNVIVEIEHLYNSDNMPESVNEYIEGLETGIVQENAYFLRKNDVVHEVYTIDEYTFIYAFRVYRVINHLINDKYKKIEFFTVMLHEEWGRAIVFNTSIYFVTAADSAIVLYLLNEALNDLPIEEMHEIAQYYQPAHKEVITGWANSEKGRNYLEYWKRPK